MTIDAFLIMKTTYQAVLRNALREGEFEHARERPGIARQGCVGGCRLCDAVAAEIGGRKDRGYEGRWYYVGLHGPAAVAMDLKAGFAQGSEAGLKAHPVPFRAGFRHVGFWGGIQREQGFETQGCERLSLKARMADDCCGEDALRLSRGILPQKNRTKRRAGIVVRFAVPLAVRAKYLTGGGPAPLACPRQCLAGEPFGENSLGSKRGHGIGR